MIKFFPAGNGKDGDLMRLFQAISEVKQELDIFLNYESFEKAIDTNKWDHADLLKIQYKILFRQWKLIDEKELDNNIEKKALRPQYNDNGKISWIETGISIRQLVEINAGYYNKEFASSSESGSPRVDGSAELGYYTDPIIDNESVIDIFFMHVFPMLNVKEFLCQTRASQMLKNAPFHLVFDEVGTGKTVTALYSIREELLEKNSSAKILILCPNNKKSEWIKDIQRQLGLYAHEVPNSIADAVYSEDLKSIYFMEGEPCIFVEGQKKSEKKQSLDTWNDEERWDLVVIDECHLCFDNYETVRSEKLLLLTATPIVINSRSTDGSLENRKERKVQDYIDLAKRITGCQGNIEIKNLFSNHDYFTQLFREDLGMNPKQRKIIFKYTDRLGNRDEYLDALGTAVGGMTRLIYEQDDDFLMYGVFERFRNKLEEEGYYISDEPEKVENHKYKTLFDVINENDKKNYIVFFNTKWTAENVYSKLINEFTDRGNHVVVAMKFGKDFKVWPRDNTVNGENFFDYLFSKIESGMQVIFITTGATGGTGLNLGKFDGIINYEMPFTSIELEQRFGRVDRMDTGTEQEDREMIFLLNKDYNPMLRYCLLKINATCLHMPVRNTILFCPKVIDEISNDLEKEYRSYELEAKELDFIAEKNKLSDDEKKIVENFERCIIRRNPDKFEEDIDHLSDDCNSILEYMHEKEEMVRRLHIKCKNLAIIKKELSNWIHIIGIQSDKAAPEVGSALVVSDEENDENDDLTEKSGQIIVNSFVIAETEEKDNGDIQSVCTQIEQMLQMLQDSNKEEQNASGVFYIDNNNGYRYHREKIDEFRLKCPIQMGGGKK